MCLAGCKAAAVWAKFHPMSPWAKMMFLLSSATNTCMMMMRLKHLILTSNTKHSHCSMNNSQGDNLTSHFTYLLPFDAFCLSANGKEFRKMVQYSQNKF